METAMQTRFLAVETDGVVARIVLRRPPLNVLNIDMIEELNRALRDVRYETSLKALVLAAEGKAFSAGVAVEDHMPERVRAMIGAFHDVFRHLRQLHCPVIAAVQGTCLGGGCELACFADLVIATESATFGVPEIKLGCFPPVAAVHFPHRIGMARTLQLILSGETLPAPEARRIGLVDVVVQADGLEAAVAEATARYRGFSATALKLAKRTVLALSDKAFEERLHEAEKIFLDDLMKTPDAVEGLKAFLEKRAPVWKA